MQNLRLFIIFTCLKTLFFLTYMAQLILVLSYLPDYQLCSVVPHQNPPQCISRGYLLGNSSYPKYSVLGESTLFHGLNYYPYSVRILYEKKKAFQRTFLTLIIPSYNRNQKYISLWLSTIWKFYSFYLYLYLSRKHFTYPLFGSDINEFRENGEPINSLHHDG